MMTMLATLPTTVAAAIAIATVTAAATATAADSTLHYQYVLMEKYSTSLQHE